jgi:hypothetical protein
MLLLSNWILGPIPQTTLSEGQAQPVDTISPQGKIDDSRINAHNMAKKYRDAPGEKIPNHYIVVLKDADFLSSLKSPAAEAINQGAGLRHIYDQSLHGFAIRVPNDKVLEAIMKIPEVDYVQPDV